MVKKLLCCAVLVMVLASGARGATEFERSHISLASLKDGRADYSDARFCNVEFSLKEEGVTVTKEAAQLTGSITLSGGNYSFWNGNEMQNVSGTPITYKLGLKTWLTSSDELGYQPFDDAGGELKFGIEADGGLNGVNISWNFPDEPSLNGSAVFPNFLTTQEQLDSCVLYFEFIRSGDVVTGINWRVVGASDTATPVPQDFRMRFNRIDIWNQNEDNIHKGRPQVWIEAGASPEGTYLFDESIPEADICCVRTRLFTYDDDEAMGCLHMWYYYVQKAPEMYLWSRHASDASLVNGKSDYSTANFSNVFFSIESNNPVKTEVKHFADTGRITIPGGGYTLVDADTGRTLSAITGDTTLKLRFDSEGAIGDEYLEYWAVDDSGRFVAFAGGAETGLNGKTVSWTFPAELGLEGNGTLPSYKTTAQQLASGVPYIEVVSEDGYITAVNYKIVTASDTSTAITPAYRTDFRIYFDRAEGKDVWANTYRPGWIRNTASGTLTLDIPQPLSIVKRIRVRLRSYEDSANPAVYQWNFYPVSAPAPLEITTATLPNATAGTSYTVTLAANVPGVAWRVSSGTLPTGITLNSSTGAISGIPTTEGTATFTVTATLEGHESTGKTFTLAVSQVPTPQTVEITTTTIPEGVAGMPYNAELASNPDGATWTLTGNLPAGLVLDSSGRISGTPTVAGEFQFTVTARYGTASDVRRLTLTVNPLEITTASLPDGIVGDAYNQTFSSNGSGLKWTVNAGALPAGLTLNEDSGVLSGTLTEAGEYTFTVYAYNTHASASKQFTVNVQSNGSGGGGGGGCNGLAGLAAIASLAFFLRKR